MRNKGIALTILFGCLLLAVSAQAGTITVSTDSQGWQFISQNTYGLPAHLEGINCGSENETTCEPTGVFHFNVTFAAASTGTWNLMDPPSIPGGPTTISDTIMVFNDASGLGVLSFNGDPATQTAGISLGVEAPCPTDVFPFFPCGGPNGQGGIVAPLSLLDTQGDVIIASLASDSEVTFDPFGLHADSSDEVQFSGNVTPQVPEPSSLLLLGSGLLSLAGAKKWRLLP
jgi:hypothetical protein